MASTVETRTVEELMTSGPTSIANARWRRGGEADAVRRRGLPSRVDEDRLVGMVTDRDLVLQVMAKDLDPSKVPVSEVCTRTSDGGAEQPSAKR
jgi:CBS domain-containing protein